MRFASPLLLAIALALPAGLSAKDPSQVDATKQDTQLAPSAENADNPLSTSRESNQRTFVRNDHLQDQRFSAPEPITRKDAVVGEKRASIDMTETREKNIVDRKDYPKPEVREHEVNRHDGERARIQPKDDQVKKYDTVEKYQNRMTDAKTAAAQRQPTMEKRTTFESINRFVFMRNGPGTEDGKPMVTPAAGGSAPASQDTHTKYEVNWRRAPAVSQ